MQVPAEERLRCLVEQSIAGVYIIQGGRFTFVNARFASVFGYTPEELIGVEDPAALVCPEDRAMVVENLRQRFAGNLENAQYGFRGLRRDGTLVPVEVESSYTTSGGEPAVVGLLVDTSVRTRAEEALRLSELHDRLTGLPNRALLLDRLAHAIDRLRRRPSACFSVLFLDLDRFKLVNDSLGHGAGDLLLLATARRLAQAVTRSDTVARLGGDEFVVLLEDTDPQDAVALATRLGLELSAPLVVYGQEVVCTPTIGIAHSSSRYQRPEEMLRDADTAMYRAKAAGRAGHCEFDPSMHATAVRTLQLESELRRALERHELVIFYQPVVSLRTGRITGAEALVHWNHPQRGLTRPLDFIPLAEETGLIQPIGEWVLRNAARQAREWQLKLAGAENFAIGVNLSGRQFLQSDLVEQVSRALLDAGLPPRSLRLEITESVLMEKASEAASTLSQLKLLGVQLDLDDFGTGYSSLSYLHHFRIDTLKIDRSFVSRMCDGGEPIVRTVVALARGLGMELIAEGVETQGQLARLQAMGCEQAQGYLFSRPIDSQQLETLFSREQGWQQWGLRGPPAVRAV